jgi:ABC-type multidrug transport system fused ATPase/permease subunit
VFKDIEFVYPSKTDQMILKKFNCVFEANKTTALVGPSGSGKSTIIQLLERFYDPVGGSICLDGHDIRNLNLRSMRQLIGYVGQEPVLFNCSIKENMLFAKPDATDDEIITALKNANAWDFIQEKMGT